MYEKNETENKDKTMSSATKNDRICIIGGGPAGTSAAMYLEKNGYDNYVIYEKSNGRNRGIQQRRCFEIFQKITK